MIDARKETAQVKGTTSEVSLGTAYEINKNLIEKYEKELTEEELIQKKEMLLNYLNTHQDQYFMLLCNDRKDYTVFHWNNICDDGGAMEIAKILVDECLKNRGEIRGIDITKDKGAIEIWLLIDEDAYVYYFFPYDSAIIEV